MLFYVLFIVVLAIFFANYKIGGIPKPKVFVYFGIIIFCCVLSLRFDVGWDYKGYFSSLYPHVKEWYIALAEPVYKLFCYIIIYLHLPPYFLFIFFGVSTTFFLFKSLFNYTPNVYMGLLVYLALFFETSFGFMRQGLALVIILYGYRYLRDKQLLKYYLVCAAAICCHYSAVVCLFFPLIYWFCTSFKKTLLLIAGITVAFTFALLIIMNYFQLYDNYVENDVSIGGGSLIRIMNLGIVMSLIIYAKYKRADNKYLRLLYLALTGCCFPFIFGGHLGGRLAWYFLIYLCVAIPNILEYKPNRVINRMCEGGLMCIFLALIYFSTTNPIKEPYTPYQTILTVDLKHPKFK